MLRRARARGTLTVSAPRRLAADRFAVSAAARVGPHGFQVDAEVWTGDARVAERWAARRVERWVRDALPDVRLRVVP